MFRFAPLAAVLFVAGCDPSMMPGAVPEDRVLPDSVRAFLLPGQPESVIIQDGQGCYLISNELTSPRSGYFLRDRNTGEPLCYDREGNPIPYVAPAPVEAPAEEAAT